MLTRLFNLVTGIAYLFNLGPLYLFIFILVTISNSWYLSIFNYLWFGIHLTIILTNTNKRSLLIQYIKEAL